MALHGLHQQDSHVLITISALTIMCSYKYRSKNLATRLQMHGHGSF